MAAASVASASLKKGREPEGTDVLADVFRDLLKFTAEHTVIALRNDGKIASWSTAAELMFGLTTDRALGQEFACLYPQAAVDSQTPERDLATALATGNAVSNGTYLRRADGSTFRANVRISPIFDDRGEHIGFIELVQSLDRRPHRLPQHYVNTLAEADLVLGSVHDAIFVQEPSGKLLYANRAGARHFGLEDGETFVRMPIDEISKRLEVFDEEGNQLDTFALLSTLGGKMNLDDGTLFYSRTVSTNETRWVIVRQSRIYDDQGETELVVCVATNVTDSVRSKLSEQALSETTKRLSASLDYETTLRNLADALVPRLADWAAVVCMREGVPRDVQIVSTEVELAERIRESWAKAGDNVFLSPPVAEVFRTGKPVLFENITRQQLEAFASTKAELDVVEQAHVRSMILAPIVVGDRTDGVIIVSTPESKRRYDLGDLDLMTEIGRRAGTAIEHTRLYRNAQLAIRLRNEFLAVAAHELRTPLATLTLQLQSLQAILAKETGDDRDVRLCDRLDKTIRQNRRLTRLIDSLLDVSQVAGGRLELRRSEFDLAELVADVADRLTDDAERAGSKLSFQWSAPCPGYWDADRLGQVVDNLISNAIKYGQKKPIDVTCTCDRAHVCVTVADNGIGIAPENMTRIFERFERAVPETNYGGLGLGLWISREITEAHGGKLEVASTVGQGAVFRLFLPRQRVESAPT